MQECQTVASSSQDPGASHHAVRPTSDQFQHCLKRLRAGSLTWIPPPVSTCADNWVGKLDLDHCDADRRNSSRSFHSSWWTVRLSLDWNRQRISLGAVAIYRNGTHRSWDLDPKFIMKLVSDPLRCSGADTMVLSCAPSRQLLAIYHAELDHLPGLDRTFFRPRMSFIVLRAMARCDC